MSASHPACIADLTGLPREPARQAHRLLVITYNFPPDGFVGGLRWAGITKYLARMGWKVTVLTSAATVDDTPVPGSEVERCPRLRTLGDAVRWLLRSNGRSSGSVVDTVAAARWSPSSRLLLRLWREVSALATFPDDSRGWVFRAALRARSVMQRFQPTVVVSSGPPHSAHLAAGMATVGSSVRWFIDLRDPWAGPFTKAWEADPGTRAWTSRMLLRSVERLAVRAADGVITSTPDFARTLLQTYPAVPVVCVPNGVDSEQLPSLAADPYTGLGIAYAGTLYGSRDLGTVVQALRVFLDRHPEAAVAGSRLRIAGLAEAPHAMALSRAVAAAGLEDCVEVLGPLPRADALRMVSRSHVAVVLAQEQELQIPAKLYESVALGIPTLVVTGADSAAAVEGNRLGAVVRDPHDIGGIAQTLEEVWQQGRQRRSRCPVPITYEAIAPIVDELFRNAGIRSRPCG